MKNKIDKFPDIIFFGGSKFRFYERPSHAGRTTKLLQTSFSRISGDAKFINLTNERFSRPQAFYDSLETLLDDKKRLLILYYLGPSFQKTNGRLLLAHPSSNPPKSSSHIDLSSLLGRISLEKDKKVVFLLDSEGIDNRKLWRHIPLSASLLLIRRLRNSFSTWQNGGDLFSGCLAETIANSFQVIPQITFRQLFSYIAYRLNYRFATDVIDPSGKIELLEDVVFSTSMYSELWKEEESNLESKNRGSREDGLQSLIKGLMDPNYQREARNILEFFAATDHSADVRNAAKGLLSFSAHNQLDTSKRTGNRDIRPPQYMIPDWARIPQGIFLMGSDPSRDVFFRPEEKPSHPVDLGEFFISKKPVTNREWLYYLEANNLSHSRLANHTDLNLPVTWVNWYEAIDYAKWITILLQIHGLIRPDEIVRLPTEAEWEKAARGTEGRVFPWGDKFQEKSCNYRGSQIGRPVPVGTYSPRGDSPYGVQDMAGNTWDWTTSLWGKGGHKPEFGYEYKSDDGRENINADSQIRRVIRGGAFYYFDWCLRAATRNVMYPTTRHSGGGFRLVKATV